MGKGPSPFTEMNSPVNMGVKLDPRTPATNPRRVKPTICPAWQPKNTTFDLVGPRVIATGNQRGRVFLDQQVGPPVAIEPRKVASPPVSEPEPEISDDDWQIIELEKALNVAKMAAANRAKANNQTARMLGEAIDNQRHAKQAR